jgi:methionine synthase II (cobalamin-independent)
MNTVEQRGYPWAQGSATGIGSMPGTNLAEAMRMVAGELPDFPYLPELPDRGPGADLIGRTAGLLIDMPAEVTPSGWRLAERPGRDLARARSMLSSDLDVLAEVLDGYQGLVKIQLCGPWTMAATIELPRRLNATLTDAGAVADLTASLAEAAAAHVAEVLKRVPGAQLVVQFDEPALPAVAEGAIPTASGWSRLAAIEADTLRDGIAQVLAAVPGYTVVHCCAATVPFGIIRAAGADAVSFDLSQLRRGEEDAVAEAAEAGMGLLTGAIPALPDLTTGAAGGGRDSGAGRGGRHGRDGGAGRAVRAGRSGGASGGTAGGRVGGGDGARETAERVIRLWRRLGLPLATCADQAVVTPACGLAGASEDQARAALTRCREAAGMLAELIEETGGEFR